MVANVLAAGLDVAAILGLAARHHPFQRHGILGDDWCRGIDLLLSDDGVARAKRRILVARWTARTPRETVRGLHGPTRDDARSLPHRLTPRSAACRRAARSRTGADLRRLAARRSGRASMIPSDVSASAPPEGGCTASAAATGSGAGTACSGSHPTADAGDYHLACRLVAWHAPTRPPRTTVICFSQSFVGCQVDCVSGRPTVCCRFSTLRRGHLSC